MSFGSDFLKGFFGSDYLKDYTHGSKTFRANAYELAPKYKFLFYVRFNLNTVGIPALQQLFPPGTSNELGLVVKSADLPSYTFEVETMNQYNRKRLVQSKINYQPVTMRFHDDGSNLITNLWYNYFSYYYKDPSHQYQNVANTNGTAGDLGALTQSRTDYNSRDTYVAYRDQNDWGYVGESYSDSTGAIPSGGKPRFFNDITIYSMNQQKFSQYTLINPIISDWKHDTHDYSEANGTMEHTMTIQYETVKYYSGNLNDHVDNPGADSLVKGFADPTHYDTVKSPLSRGGSTGSVLGPGGIVDGAQTIAGAITDPTVKNILGAVQAGGNINDLIKDPKFRAVIEEEGNQVIDQVLRNQRASETVINKADGVFFPKNPAVTTTSTATGKVTSFNKTATPKPVNQAPQGPETGTPTAPKASSNPKTTNVSGGNKKYSSRNAAKAAAENVGGWPRAYADRAVVDNGDGTFSYKPKTGQNKQQVFSERGV